MQFKKSGGKIYDVELNAAERRALNAKAGQAMAEYVRKNDLEIEAVVIRQLRILTGWGEVRLKRFYDGFVDELDMLTKRYEMSGTDEPWLCMKELKDEGFDIEQWHRERKPNEKFNVKME